MVPLPQKGSRKQAPGYSPASRAIAAANGNARNFHLSNPAVRLAAHTALRLGGALAPAMPLRRFDWLYGHDVTKG